MKEPLRHKPERVLQAVIAASIAGGVIQTSASLVRAEFGAAQGSRRTAPKSRRPAKQDCEFVKRWNLGSDFQFRHQAAQLRDKARAPRPDPKSLWLGGEYTTHNKEHN